MDGDIRAVRQPRAAFEAAIEAVGEIRDPVERARAATSLAAEMERLAVLARRTRRLILKQAWEESGETMREFGLEMGISKQRMFKIAQEEVEAP